MGWYPGKLIGRAFDRTRTQVEPAAVQEITRELELINNRLIEAINHILNAARPISSALEEADRLVEKYQRIRPEVRREFAFFLREELPGSIYIIKNRILNIADEVWFIANMYGWTPNEYRSPQLINQIKQLEELSERIKAILPSET